jgi:hypothetical protein
MRIYGNGKDGTAHVFLLPNVNHCPCLHFFPSSCLCLDHTLKCDTVSELVTEYNKITLIESPEQYHLPRCGQNCKKNLSSPSQHATLASKPCLYISFKRQPNTLEFEFLREKSVHRDVRYTMMGSTFPCLTIQKKVLF